MKYYANTKRLKIRRRKERRTILCLKLIPNPSIPSSIKELFLPAVIRRSRDSASHLFRPA